MPRVDELIEHLEKGKYLSMLDLCNGYWQIPMTESAKELNAFRVPSGLYHFMVMPFGVHGAAVTFQRKLFYINVCYQKINSPFKLIHHLSLCIIS